MIVSLFLLKNTPSSHEYLGFVSSTEIDVKLLQNANALYPISVTELGMFTDTNLGHFMNAVAPILVIVLGISIEFKLAHQPNAPSTTAVTE